MGRDPSFNYFDHMDFLHYFWNQQPSPLICHYCKEEISREHHYSHPKRATIDHIIPLSKGGRRYLMSNVVVACNSCNLEKSDRLPEELDSEQKLC